MRRSRGRPAAADSGLLRQLIVEAAVAEFAEAGFQGARMEKIAQRAGCSRPLVYFHFRNKEALFQAALEEGAQERRQQMTAQPPTLADALVYWFGRNLADPKRLRLLMQEALSAEMLPPNPARQAYFDQQLGAVRAFQVAGLLRADVEPRHLLLTILSVTTFPAAFPKMAQACLGRDEGFPVRQEWERALRRLAGLLAPLEGAGGAPD